MSNHIPENNDSVVSTNTRKKSYKRRAKLMLSLKMIRATYGILGFLSPLIAGWWASRMWLATHRFPEPAREKAWLKSASHTELAHKFGPIALYQWHTENEAAPTVLLIHGWNGRGMQLAAFVEPLISQGFNVISFDAPGHGRSSGKQCNLLRIADVVHEISNSFGAIDIIIGHSFGAMVMARVARDGLNVRKAIAISSPLNADYLLDEFCSTLNIKGKSKTNLLQRIYNRFGEDIFTRISAVDNVKYLKIPGLIVHDKQDHNIPSEHAQALNKAWKGSELLITDNLGHLRILRNKKVIDSVIEFITKD